MPKPDPLVAKKISSLCGKLKSAWSLLVGFDTRLDGLLPEILTLPSDQIDACFEKATKGDVERQRCMVPIACAHLFHPSLHHRIPGWLEDDLLQFRDKVLHAIGKFRLHEFAPALNKFLFHPKLEGVYGDYRPGFASLIRHEARGSAALLQSTENLAVLLRGLDWENTAENRMLVDCLRSFPQFDAKPYLQKWFRESRVVDEIDICQRYVAGLISGSEKLGSEMEVRVIWDMAEQYGEYERQEAMQFLIQHLDFTERWFSSPKLSQTILCRGRRATEIIAKLNGWMPGEYEQSQFISSLWDTLRGNPSLALQAECPVNYESLPKNKTHLQIAQLFRTYDRVLHKDSELGYSLRQTEKGNDTIIALQVPGWRHWRMMRLSQSDKQLFDAGELPAEHIFHRYSSRGALVAYPSQVVFNADYLENKFAAKALRKLTKREKAMTAKRENLLSSEDGDRSNADPSP
jgi:hypothetical protein